MEFFKWNDEYSVNIKEIDQQHKHLVEMLNELFEAMKSGQGSSVTGEILTKMVDYAATHFIIEEKYMTQYEFPGYTEHKTEHEAFIAKVLNLLKRYKKTPTFLSVETAGFLKEWLQTHILGTDKLYGPYLNEKGVY
ncbi:MAG: hemerythrin family protein [Chloroflexi bacterium]|nr:hemerythrin family protein [Chloroflexota bacterium]